jgi:hypothetical protein
MVKLSNVPININPKTVFSNIHSRACRWRLRQKEEVGNQNGGTPVGHLTVWVLINNKNAQHKPNFVPRPLLPRMQVLSSSLEGLDNGSTDNLAYLLDQVACDLRAGLQAPTLATMGNLVTGAETDKLRLQNRQRRHSLQDQQMPMSMWTIHTGATTLPTMHKHPTNYHNEICPAWIAKSHPAGELLAKWAQLGCPTKMGCPWSKEDI